MLQFGSVRKQCSSELQPVLKCKLALSLSLEEEYHLQALVNGLGYRKQSSKLYKSNFILNTCTCIVGITAV